MCVAAVPAIASAGVGEDAVAEQVNRYMPGVSGFGTVKIERVTVNNQNRTVKVKLNRAGVNIPLTAERLAELKSDIADALGKPGYRVTVTSDGRNLDRLVLFADKTNRGPSESAPFVVRHGAAPAPAGLDGTNIAVWQSHGLYFEPKTNRWEFQRARVLGTVEDTYTQSYVVPFVMPMLENAGAYVMSPRDRDTGTIELIVDNDGMAATGQYSEHGGWGEAGTGFGYFKEELREGDNPFRAGTARKSPLSGDDEASARATWTADIPEAGTYAVYVSYVSLPNSTTEAHYRVKASNGDHDVSVNQRMGGGTWIYLGHYPFDEGRQTVVELDNAGADRRRAVTADAVKIGGGLGNVARAVSEPLDSINYRYTTSGAPRFIEGARYWLQWAGAPDSVITPGENANDYGDDYKCRGLWVNWLAGGSSMLPEREGLGIPLSLSMAFHTDAGTTDNDSIVGTLGIYSTAGETLGNGSDRMASRDLTDLIMTNICDDVRATFEPNWTRRGLRDASYYEARVPEVPSMLLELLSHQNYADMTYGLDPAFRFVVSRAVYKAMLKFIAQRDGRPYVVQPLPVRAFAISKTGSHSFRLSWAEQVDSLEETAHPTYYIIEERCGGNGFRKIGQTADTHFEVTVGDDAIHSYRIIAANDGGTAFPSEVLALCDKPGTPVTIVNGFTRVSAPDMFDFGEIAGLNAYDHGVPYVDDLLFIGDQVEFRRNQEWRDDDAPGFGASRNDYANTVIAGNTFDYPAIHGEAIAAAGHGFVSTSIEAFMSATDTPAIVDLILGKQKEIKRGRGVFGTYFKTYPAGLQSRMRTLAASGTSFFVSGSYVATDLWDNPNSSPETAAADQAFAREVLGYAWRMGRATDHGEVRIIDSRFRDFTGGTFEFDTELNPDLYAVESPDGICPADAATAAPVMVYNENEYVAGTAMTSRTHKAVVTGFPFETISDAGQRENLMKQILDFFGDRTPVNARSSRR